MHVRTRIDTCHAERGGGAKLYELTCVSTKSASASAAGQSWLAMPCDSSVMTVMPDTTLERRPVTLFDSVEEDVPGTGEGESGRCWLLDAGGWSESESDSSEEEF